VLQIGRSLVQSQLVSVDFSLTNTSDRTMALVSTQPLTEYQEYFLGEKASGA